MKTEMKHMSEAGSKKRKEVGNESPLASMFYGTVLFRVMSPSRIPNPEDDKFDEYGVSEMKELWQGWGKDVEGSGQVHPAILNNDLGVGALLLE